MEQEMEAQMEQGKRHMEDMILAHRKKLQEVEELFQKQLEEERLLAYAEVIPLILFYFFFCFFIL